MDYYTLITDIGAAKIATATANNTTINLTQIAVGDGNGSIPLPNASNTTLVKEVYRADLNDLRVDSNNPNWIIAEGYIPSTAGNFWVREVALFDVDGDLIAIGNYPETFKPLMADGIAKDIFIRMIFEVSSSSAVTLQIDPSVVMASREFVDTEIDRLDLKFNTIISTLGFPVGFETFEAEARANQLYNLGGEFNRADHPNLWLFIEASPLLKTEAEWQTENTTNVSIANPNGMCGYFSSGDGTTTFRLKNLEGATLKAVNGVDELAGRFELDQNKAHIHVISNQRLSGSCSGGSTTYKYGGSKNTNSEGGDENTVKNIGVLPLIVAS